jgi:hypothetical protein
MTFDLNFNVQWIITTNSVTISQSTVTFFIGSNIQKKNIATKRNSSVDRRNQHYQNQDSNNNNEMALEHVGMSFKPTNERRTKLCGELFLCELSRKEHLQSGFVSRLKQYSSLLGTARTLAIECIIDRYMCSYEDT